MKLDDDIDVTVALLQEAQEEAQAALSNPPQIPEEDLDLYLAAIRSAQQMIYSASDSVTDMQLIIDDEITPSSGEIRDILVAVVNATLAESYTGLPEAWKPTFDAISVKVVDAQTLAGTSKAQLSRLAMQSTAASRREITRRLGRSRKLRSRQMRAVVGRPPERTRASASMTSRTA